MTDARRRFWLRLAAEFGVPPGVLSDCMTEGEFAEYQAMAGIEPFGSWRADMNAAQVAAAAAMPATGRYQPDRFVFESYADQFAERDADALAAQHARALDQLDARIPYEPV